MLSTCHLLRLFGVMRGQDIPMKFGMRNAEFGIALQFHSEFIIPNFQMQFIISLCPFECSVLVALAAGKHPFPFRTRQLRPPAPMVVRHQPCESRSPPRHCIQLRERKPSGFPLAGSLSGKEVLQAGRASLRALFDAQACIGDIYTKHPAGLGYLTYKLISL